MNFRQELIEIWPNFMYFISSFILSHSYSKKYILLLKRVIWVYIHPAAKFQGF